MSLLSFVKTAIFLTLANVYANANDLSPRADTQILDADMDAYIEGTIKDWGTSGGIAVAVVKRDENNNWQVETKGYGTARADGSKVDENTLFGIGSNSKLFTAVTAGLLISDPSTKPAIHWNTKLSSILPEFKLQDSIATSHATILDALSHRTGVNRHDNMPTKNDTTANIIRKMRYLKPSAEFREGFQYTNQMYTVLSRLAPTLAKTSHAQYMKTHIWDRLGMNATTVHPDDAEKSGKLAHGFARDNWNMVKDLFGAATPRAMPFPWGNFKTDDDNFPLGSGGVIMSAKDVAVWLQTLLLDGRHPVTNETIIPADVLARVTTGVTVSSLPPFDPEFSPMVYGAGQFKSTYRGHLLIEHGGDIPGYTSQYSRLPNDNFAVAVLTNEAVFGEPLTDAVKLRIMDKVLGLDQTDWNTRRRTQAQEQLAASVAAAPAPPKEPKQPSVSLAALAGVYTDAGYGDVELCLATPAVPGLKLSASCKMILAEANTTLPGAINWNSQVPTFLIKWDKLLSSHVVMTHFDADTWAWSQYSSLPVLGNNATQPFWALATSRSGIATFGSGGFGLSGSFWGPAFDAAGPAPGKTLQETSQVWFQKKDGKHVYGF